MGLFSKRQHVGESTEPNVSTIPKEKTHDVHDKRQPVILSMSRRPPFGQWLKIVLLDLITMAAMGAIGLGVYEAHPAPSRSFPVYFQNGEVVYPQFAYPLRTNIIPIWAAALIAFFVPFTVFLICQIRVRSFWDVNNATIGLLYALINAAVFQVFLKWLIGGLRPHFLTVCAPNVPQFSNQETGTGLSMIMYDRTICTGDEDEIDDSLESFPSGHTTAAFAGFVFLYLYLNAKLKVFSNYHPAFWKLIALYAPILGAVLIGGSLTIDEYHNWYDVVAGAIIGTIMGFSAYRMVYMSVWDFRFNHIPSHRAVPSTYGTAPIVLSNAVFTHQAGWGEEGFAMTGAPFDAITGGRTEPAYARGLNGDNSYLGDGGSGNHKRESATTSSAGLRNQLGRKPVATDPRVRGDGMV